MRRMLDPKEAGGNTAKLYKHMIRFWSSTYGTIYLTIYNTSIEQITSESKLKPAMANFGDALASGYIKNGNVYFTVSYAYLEDRDKKVKALGYRVNSEGQMTNFSVDLDYHFSTIEDNVKEVR